MKWVWPAVLALIMIVAAIPSPAAAQSVHIMPDPDMIGPGTKLTVLIADGSLDAGPNSVDEYEAEDFEFVTFATDRGEVDEGVPDIEETGQNTGIFEFELQLVTDAQACEEDDLGGAEFEAAGGSDPSIGVCPGDILSIEYEDPFGDGVFSTSVEIKSWDPEFVADRDILSSNDRVNINITDPDANRDPDIADSIRDIRVYSDSDQVGEEFTALETGKNTGVFQLTFSTSPQGQGNTILTEGHEFLSVEYTDEFPADFATTTTEKTFIFIMSVTNGDSIETVTSSPVQISADGAPAAGKQIILSTVITNNVDMPQSFVELIEVRDSDGVTMFLAWQGGTLDPLDQRQIGVSWTPDQAGDYEARTFAINSFESSQILSQVEESYFTIE